MSPQLWPEAPRWVLKLHNNQIWTDKMKEAARTILRESAFFHETTFFTGGEIASVLGCDFHSTIPFSQPKRWSGKFRRAGRRECEALSGMLRNPVTLMYEYLGEKQVWQKAEPRKGAKQNAFSQCWSGILQVPVSGFQTIVNTGRVHNGSKVRGVEEVMQGK